MMRSYVLAAMMVAAPAAGQVPVPAPDTSRRPLATPSMTPTVGAATTPGESVARAVDAEVRVGLFEVLNSRPLSAMSRLERIRPVASGGVREPMLFLLSQAYFQLGITSSFRSTAQELLSSSGTNASFAGVLRSQLMVDAYRAGEYSRAQELAAAGGAAGDASLTALVAGLVRLQAKDYAGARESFAASVQAGGAYAAYAQYMDAVATLQGDSTQGPAALESLRALSASTTGEFADQVRLTAAQVAYGVAQFDVAIGLAEQIAPTSGLGAEAQLTRAWALYKAGRFEAAAGAFADFATRYPQLAQRDEARLMAGQAMLDAGRADDAVRHFRNAADSMAGETSALQAQGASAMADAARALVRARAAGIAFLTDAQNGKALAIPDAAGADYATILKAFSDTGAVIGTRPIPPELVSLADVDARLGGMDAVASGIARRAVYAPASPATVGKFGDRAQTLSVADVRFALAQHRLQLITDESGQRIAQLNRLQRQLAADSAGLAALELRLAATEDSLTRMAGLIEAARATARRMVQQSVDAARQLAMENQTKVDSARMAVAAASGADRTAALLNLESQTATLYREMADLVERSLDRLLARSSVLAQRDSVRTHLDRVRPLLAETRKGLAVAASEVSSELSTLESGETARARAAKAALARAEAQRTAAEAGMVNLLTTELQARGRQLVALLRRDTEAADYGSASASFFKAVDAARSPTAPGITPAAADAPSRAGTATITPTPPADTKTTPRGSPR